MLERQSPAEIVGKRAFEMLAATEVTITTLDVFLPVALIGGLILMLAAGDRERLLHVAPALILALGVFVAYTVFIPYKAQAGSFKKAYVSLIPLIVPLAGYAFDRAVPDRRIQIGAMALAIALMGANALEAVRQDARAADTYLAKIQAAADAARALPDANGDGAIVLMTEDPFIVRYVGLRSIMYPSEDRDTTLEVARRYGVDYLLFPPGRPALDALATGAETDARLALVAPVAGTHYSLWSYR
jgi:hypothetical protein